MSRLKLSKSMFYIKIRKIISIEFEYISHLSCGTIYRNIPRDLSRFKCSSKILEAIKLHTLCNNCNKIILTACFCSIIPIISAETLMKCWNFKLNIVRLSHSHFKVTGNKIIYWIHNFNWNNIFQNVNVLTKNHFLFF